MALERFGLFEFDPATGALARNGHPIHLQAQPAKILALLLSARGAIVTREALREALWTGNGTTVDFDRGLNFAIGQVRAALGDSADSPVYIKTVPKRGYQFIAPIIAGQPNSRRSVLQLAVPIGAAAIAAAAFAAFRRHRTPPPRIAVARFQNETGNPSLDRLADAITDLLVAGLTTATAGRYGIIGNAAILRQPRSFQDVEKIGAALHADYVILGQVQPSQSIRVLAHLIRLPEQTHLTVSRIELSSGTESAEAAAHQIVAKFTAAL